MPDDQAMLHAAKPIYEEFPGWKTSLSACREIHDLPAEARDFIAALEAQSGVPVNLVGVGPGRDEYIQFA